VLEHSLSTLPVGYEWPNGQTLASASTYYPDYYSKKGSGVLVDRRGRVAAGKDDMGGTSANRLTGLTGGVDGDTLGATGGEEANILTTAQIPAHSHPITDKAHSHNVTLPVGQNSQGGNRDRLLRSPDTGAMDLSFAGAGTSSMTGITKTENNVGGGGAHNNVQPTIIQNFIVVVE
jgi:microcystin-dependent protein